MRAAPAMSNEASQAAVAGGNAAKRGVLSSIENTGESQNIAGGGGGKSQRRYSFQATDVNEVGASAKAERPSNSDAPSDASEIASLRSELAALGLKYERLKQLRFADVEGIYGSYKQSVKQRAQASDELLAMYRNEADQLRTLTQRSKEVNASKELEQFRRQNASLKAELLDVKAQLVERELGALNVRSAPAPTHNASAGGGGGGGDGGELSAEAAARLRMYEILTGAVLRVKRDDGGGGDDAGERPPPRQFDVLSVNAADDRRLRFTLRMADNASDVEYEPVELSLASLDDGRVPAYLRENIVFESSQAPIFMSKLASVLFSR